MSNQSMKSLFFASAAAAVFAAASANAAVVPYTGSDDDVASLSAMPNSVAVSNLFNAATPGRTLVDFESALPAVLTISGGSTTNVSGCGALCGFNTSSGGANFRLLTGGTATFSFSSGVEYFGFYITGLQTDRVGQQTVTFSDGSVESIMFPAAVQGANGGGGAFIGFTDFGKSITSITVDVSNDIVAIDDVRFGLSRAVPEPASWAMMIGGFALVGAGMRRRKAAIRFA